MLHHFVAVVAALTLTTWSTILTQYHEFRGTDPIVYERPVVVNISPTTVLPPPSLGTVLEDLVQHASGTPFILATSTSFTPQETIPGPVQDTQPSVPFTPLVIPTPSPAVVTEAAPAPTPSPVVETINQELRDEVLLRAAIVNIICLPGGGLRGSSGTGVVIDPRGIILTVAHVGQNFLLTDYPEENAGSCYIRTGSPAKNAYTAELIFLSPSWIEENELTFLSSRPKGTGEHDFALVAITGSLTSSPVPSRFAYLPLSPVDTEIESGDRVGTGSYAAEFLTSSEVRSSLYPTIKFADIDDVLTFARNTIDIFSVAAGSAAQEGSSGGAVINEDGELIGLITTRTVKPDLASRTLQALTMDHIRRSFRSDTGLNLDSYIRGSIPTLVADYNEDSIELKGTLFEAIDEARD